MRFNDPIALVITGWAAIVLAHGMSSAHAAEIIDPARVVTGDVTGALVVIDVPFVRFNPTFGGPAWTDAADSGFTTLSAEDGGADDGIREPMNGTSPWEPDGTPLAEAKCFFTFGNGPAPSVTWNFNLADSGIDLPDGAVINAIFATWLTRNVDGITYEFTEGAASGSTVRQRSGAAPEDDLVLRWIDADSAEHTGNFEKIFDGPITVTGGDGFTLWGTDNIANAAHIDAVVLDVTGAVAVDPAFDITEFDYSPGTDEITLTWTSDPGSTYAVKYSTDMMNWEADLDDGVDGDEAKRPRARSGSPTSPQMEASCSSGLRDCPLGRAGRCRSDLLSKPPS